MSGQIRTVKVGYEWKEVGVGMQRMVLLVPTYGVEPLKMSTSYDVGQPEACCHELPSDADEQDNNAADVLPRRSLDSWIRP